MWALNLHKLADQKLQAASSPSAHQHNIPRPQPVHTITPPRALAALRRFTRPDIGRAVTCDDNRTVCSLSAAARDCVPRESPLKTATCNSRRSASAVAKAFAKRAAHTSSAALGVALKRQLVYPLRQWRRSLTAHVAARQVSRSAAGVKRMQAAAAACCALGRQWQVAAGDEDTRDEETRRFI